jgi:hypothetical protein
MIKTIEKLYPSGNKFEMKQDSRYKCIIILIYLKLLIQNKPINLLPKMLKTRKQERK